MEGVVKLTPIMETGWKDERNGEKMAEVLRVLDSKNSWPRQGAEEVAWAVPLVAKSNGSSMTCEQTIMILAIVFRTNVLFSRCGISRNRLGMHLEPLRDTGGKPPSNTIF